ncbi:MAG: acyl-CoA thioesterase [Caldilineales bacterium]|nr:acyl-CoA thioesterase [Caldilineales bacterium]
MSHTKKRPFEVSLVIPVRPYDVDFLGIVHNIVYIRWLEDLRMQVLAEYFPLEPAMTGEGIVPVLLRTAIDYRRPIRLFDPVMGHMWLKEVGRVRYVLSAQFKVHGELMAEAEQVGCFVDLITRRPVPVPAAIRAAMQLEGEPTVEAAGPS